MSSGYPAARELGTAGLGAAEDEAPLLTVYSTTWCGYCIRLKRQLDGAGIAYAAVDIEEDPAAEDLVRAANGGNATVPTVVFRDGSALTNPSAAQVAERAAALGG